MIYNEKWERTKRYLFRNLLEDPGYRLSPVTEESVSDDLVSRPYSPLPDLVIEPEPNRHDDPPEFYQGLEDRMRRLYKRLVEDRASSEETEGLINLEKDISEYNVDQHISHHGLLELYQATPIESDPEIFHANNVLKEIQNISKENKDKSAEDISPVIGLGRTTIVNRTTEMEFTESNFDCAHFISTGNDKSTGKVNLGNKCDDLENKNEQLELRFRSSPIISYGRTMLDIENKSHETELTELDMDLTNVISTKENETKLIVSHNTSKSIETKDGQSKQEFEKQSTVDFASKTFSVDGKRTTETELTESDENDTHVISTTTAEIHEEPLSGKTVVVETESPILVPKLQKISSAEDFSGLTRNCVLVDKAQDKNESETMDDVEMTNENKKQDTIIDNTDHILDREVANILQNAKAVTLEPIKEVNRDSEKSKESSEDNEELFEFLKGSSAGTDAVSASEGSFASDKSSSQGRKRFQNADECVSDNSFELAIRKEAFERINKRKTFDHSSEVESETEEINDYKEYLIFVQQIRNDDESDIDSFEIAMCRETFQRINRGKGFGQSSGELHSVTEDEEVEEMRGAPLTDPLQAFKRRSTASQESLLGTFAKPTVAEIHEDISIGDEGLHTSCKSPEARADGCLSEECTGMKSPVLGCSFTQTYKDVNCQGGMSIDNEEHTNVFPGPLKSQSGIGIEEDSEAQNSPDSHNTDDISENKPTKSYRLDVRESSVGTEETTPSAPKDNVMSTLCDVIWSVSPIPINAADFSPVTPSKVFNKNVPTKRRQKFSSEILEKRKKYQNKVVQTSTDPNSWESIKSDFFVGTPHMFKLCSCNDHTCRK